MQHFCSLPLVDWWNRTKRTWRTEIYSFWGRRNKAAKRKWQTKQRINNIKSSVKNDEREIFLHELCFIKRVPRYWKSSTEYPGNLIPTSHLLFSNQPTSTSSGSRWNWTCCPRICTIRISYDASVLSQHPTSAFSEKNALLDYFHLQMLGHRKVSSENSPKVHVFVRFNTNERTIKTTTANTISVASTDFLNIGLLQQ